MLADIKGPDLEFFGGLQQPSHGTEYTNLFLNMFFVPYCKKCIFCDCLVLFSVCVDLGAMANWPWFYMKFKITVVFLCSLYLVMHALTHIVLPYTPFFLCCCVILVCTVAWSDENIFLLHLTLTYRSYRRTLYIVDPIYNLFTGFTFHSPT